VIHDVVIIEQAEMLAFLRAEKLCAGVKKEASSVETSF
jgi:hypothetical protein